MANQQVDARGLTCPLPVLKLRKALKDVKPGQTVEMFATDPGTLGDVPHFCETSGYELLESGSDEADAYRFVIRKAYT